MKTRKHTEGQERTNLLRKLYEPALWRMSSRGMLSILVEVQTGYGGLSVCRIDSKLKTTDLLVKRWFRIREAVSKHILEYRHSS